MASMIPREPKDVLKFSLRFRGIILNGAGLYFGIFKLAPVSGCIRSCRPLVEEAKERNVKITVGDLKDCYAHLEP